MIFENIFKYIKVLLINILLLYIFLYPLEILVNYKDNTLFKKTRLYYLNIFKKKQTNKKIYLNFAPYKLLDNKEINLLPLSGYKNSMIILCLDEFNKPVYYYSDNNGFNNQNKYIENDLLLLGDSYVQGMCVNTKDNLNSQFTKLNYKTTSLGVGGNGPLIELATFQEYENQLKYKKLILFITASNDFLDLSKEIKSEILKNYLREKNFKQNIYSEDNEIKKKNILDSYFKKKQDRFLNDFFSIYHFNLKKIGNLIEKILKKENILDNKFMYLKNNSLDDQFLKILSKFIAMTKDENKDFFVVFNSEIPDILYPNTKNEFELNNLLLEKKIPKIKNFLNKEGVSFFDFNKYLLDNYDKKNASKFFKKINNKWDHYNEKGFLELAEQISIKLD
tara:strand:- start:5 stop:1180 length:1176 start_codon:yes stop_codon:yes gene_type:complete